jgi:enamine deaminase RidA (YjgF/YER057c/UK114 family)
VGDTLHVSGLLGSDMRTGQFPEDFESEVKGCLDKIGLVLRAAGMDFSDTAYFKEPRPARVTSGAARLAGKARIEIAAVARR